MREFEKYYTFHLKLSSPDTPGFNPSHYVLYIRTVLSLRELELEFYFASASAAESYRQWMGKIDDYPDPDECRGYATRKYVDDIVSRVSAPEEYFPVGRIQYVDFTVEIILKKSQHATEVYFISGDKPQLDALYEAVDVDASTLEPYGIAMERGPPPTETHDEKFLSLIQTTSQLMIVDAGDVGRVY